jgi:predicted  nucleic acid-binding Zn-ribbon protein
MLKELDGLRKEKYELGSKIHFLEAENMSIGHKNQELSKLRQMVVTFEEQIRHFKANESELKNNMLILEEEIEDLRNEKHELTE